MSQASRRWIDVFSEHQQVLAQLESAGPTLDVICDVLIDCFKSGSRVYIAGNGGSAADAQHIAAELLGRYKLDRRALPAVALTTDSSTLTAISNDLGYDRIFARQIEGLARPGDVVWLISTSGKSPNILEAARTASALGTTVIGFTGDAGDQLAELCTHVFRAPHTAAERIQEAHLLAYHYICERVERALA